MNALIVLANCGESELMRQAREEVARKLSMIGYDFTESDLDRMRFNPVISLRDYPESSQVSMSKAQNEAYPLGYAKDILEEMQKIKSASIIFIFIKLTYGLVPTVFLGWLQRVFPLKFAVFSEDKLLYGKKVLFIVAGDETGSSENLDKLITPFAYYSFTGIHMKCLKPYMLSNQEHLLNLVDRLTEIDQWPILDSLP